jgi:NADH dehydrogenase
MDDDRHTHRVVIVGGGFGGLYAAKSLGSTPTDVTLVDRRNFHLFQPLLYQVATGGLSPADISSPLRAVLKRARNIRVLKGEVVRIDAGRREVALRDGSLSYDTLVVATGASHHYFGHDEWAPLAPGFKSIEDALDIRRRIFTAFEAAERETDPDARRAWMTFVVIGGGPTGVELAGALAELARFTLAEDFRRIDTRDTRVILVEATERLLPPYPPDLSRKAEASLVKLGVLVERNTFVSGIEEAMVTATSRRGERRFHARTVIWAAGVKASGLGHVLAKETGVELDRAGRVIVEPDLSVRGHPEILVIGDLAHFGHQGKDPLPGTAPVAMQQGRYVGKLIQRRLTGGAAPPFRYRNRGNLTVIGRNRAVADFRRLRLSGYPAWLAWVFVHIWYLIEYDNKLLVMIQWAFDYVSRKRGARLIVETASAPVASGASPDDRLRT